MSLFANMDNAQLVAYAENAGRSVESWMAMSEEERAAPRGAKGDGLSPTAAMTSLTLPMFVMGLQEMRSRGLPVGDWQWLLDAAEEVKNEQASAGRQRHTA